MGSHNTGREVRAPDCHECVKLNVHRTKAQRTLHCDNRESLITTLNTKKMLTYQDACPAIDADGRKCGRKKRKSEYGCEDHPPPPPPPRACEADGCRLPPLKRSPYCHLHTCTFPDCQKFSNPASGMDFCVDRTQPSPYDDCTSILTFVQIGALRRDASRSARGIRLMTTSS
ncbi:hypothetical protein BKA64DRAFT_109192 [Cadophora sp. MPI-SDFR-AT-0126]|nr:hypothetical protein BKA64DRAFT_109192 [Leotiomycetes sp. MPI-SDFR-AT-0126]